MYCIINGKVCVMVFDEQKNEWKYIPEKKWNKLPPKIKNRFRIDDD